ncbi:MAG: hypothetical protein AB8B51_14785 [Sedimentitalea sp.]
MTAPAPDHARFFRLEHVALVVVLIALTTFAVLRADKIFNVYQSDTRVCGGFDTAANRCAPIGPEPLLNRYPTGVVGFFGIVPCDDWHASQHPFCRDIAKHEVGTLVDPMLTTGYVTALFGLWLSLWLNGMFARLSQQLDRDGIIRWGPEDDARIAFWRLRLSYGLTCLIMVLMVAGMLISHFEGLPQDRDDWEFFLSSVVLGGLCGHRLGTAAAMGLVGRIAARRSDVVRLIVGHSDKMGGAQRLGEFLAFQCILISIPIIWLSLWLLLVWNYGDVFFAYHQWIMLHLALLCVALAVSFFSFVRPLFLFSTHYRRSKDGVMRDWIARTRTTLDQLQNTGFQDNWQDVHAAIEQSGKITETSERIAALPTVPLRRSMQGWFSLSTLFPVALFSLEALAPENAEALGLLRKVISLIGGVMGG